MAEFVERELERLVPAFEGLERSKLYSDIEFVRLKENFRRFEYSITKRTKEVRDYYEYADYIVNVVTEISHRRKKERNFEHMINVDKVLKYKVGDLCRKAEERFKSEDVFRQEIEYLRIYNLRGMLSEAFTRRIQLYGFNPRYHEEAGRFEFFENNSAENARVVLHGALRRFFMDVNLWVALLDVEIGYAKLVRKRIIRLQGQNARAVKKQKQAVLMNQSDSGVDDETAVQVPNGNTDAVLNLKLAQLVYTQAREKLNSSTASETEFMYKAWRSAVAEGDLGSNLEGIIYTDLANISPTAEEFILAQCYREEKLSSYDLYDTALSKMRTEKMCRLYGAFCDERLSHDVFASTKLAEILAILNELGAATTTDYKRWMMLCADDEHVLRSALKKMPEDASTWEQLIALRIRNFLKDNSENLNEEQLEFIEIKQLVDEALQKVEKEKSLLIWRQWLELACAIFLSRKKLDKLFEHAFAATSPKIGAELRAVRLAYLAEGCLAVIDGGDETVKMECCKALRNAYNDMAKVRPSSMSLHTKYVEVEEQMDIPDVKMIRCAMENMVNEFGTNSVDVWLQYLKFYLKHSPTKVGLLHKRALVNLDTCLVDDFNEKWTLAMSNPKYNHLLNSQ